MLSGSRIPLPKGLANSWNVRIRLKQENDRL